MLIQKFRDCRCNDVLVTLVLSFITQVKVSKSNKLSSKTTFTTKSKYLTIAVDRKFKTAKNYDVEMTIEAVSKFVIFIYTILDTVTAHLCIMLVINERP